METGMLYSRIRSGGVRNEDDPTWTKSLTRNLSLLRGGWTFVNAFLLLRLLEYKSHKNQLELELVGTYRATNCIVTHRITLSNQSNRIDPGSWERRSHRIHGDPNSIAKFLSTLFDACGRHMRPVFETVSNCWNMRARDIYVVTYVSYLGWGW